MSLRTGRVIIAKNIKLDKSYKDVLDYSETDMLNLVIANKVSESNDCSFIKVDKNVISTKFSYSDAIKCNYMAMQNPNYANKWFFAFIDKVEYISDGNTNIYFTTDEFSTWYDYWQLDSCFVIREHVNDDTVGLHTQPENLETGEYICNEHYKDPTMDDYVSDLCYIMASTSEPIAGESKDTVAPSRIYNGIYTGLTYYRYDTQNPIDIILELFANDAKTDCINGIFMAPKWLAPLDSGSLYREVQTSNSPATFDIAVTKQTTLNGYTPKNNKLKCFPYNYLLLSNDIGQNSILHYEKFMTSNCVFTVRGVINPGCSINITPTYYNGMLSSDNDAISLGKFPICNFQNDMYTNWLTQNSVNILGSTVTSDDINMMSAGMSATVSGITNLAIGNYVGVGMSAMSGGMAVSNAMMQKKQHDMIPTTIRGQLNSADVVVASGMNTFHFYKMSVKAEFARSIDDYFTKYGYSINRIKQPNITGRQYYNYVQIGDSENIGYSTISNKTTPASSMEVINNIFRRGVTIWHTHSNLGNYNVNNQSISDYLFVNYIETTGTQFLNTNIIGGVNIQVETQIEVTVTNQDIPVFGLWSNYNDGSYGNQYHLTPYNNKWYFGSNGQESNGGTYNNTIGTQYHIIFNDNNGNIKINNSTIIPPFQFVGWLDRKIAISRRGSNDNNRYGRFKYFYFKIYDKELNTYLRSYRPCVRLSDNKAGFYDEVSGNFYTNNGTGDFTYG